MLKITKKHHGIHIIDCWYAEEPIKDHGIIRYKECRFAPLGGEALEFRTLLSDLTRTEEEIVGRFSKNCRYEVRRAAKEGIRCEMFTGESLLESGCLDAFVDFFVDFWESKGVDYREKEKCREEIRWYAHNHAFAVTRALQGDKTLVYHTYILDEEWVRLYQSASQYRTDEAVSQQLVGFANRYLHKEDMLYFKRMGKTMYDWGGAGLRAEVMSITRFKESFGGSEAYFTNAECVAGWKAKLYAQTVKMAQRLSRK